MTQVVLDSYFKLIIADRMTAILKKVDELPKEIVLTDEMIHDYCRKKGIKFGFIDQLVERLQMNNEVIVAQGKKQIDGENAYIKMLIEPEQKDVEPENGVGRVNFKDVLSILSAKKGDKICQKIPATDGIAGTDIYGKEIPPKKGRDLKLRAGKNTTYDEKIHTIISLIDGQVSQQRNLIHVLPSYEVHGDVSLKTGNIEFVGNVTIHGSVPAGFEIHAGGDIYIRGTVEAALINAGGTVKIGTGIVGQNKSKIIAGNDVVTTFVNQCEINASGNIIVDETIFHSVCNAKGKIICKKGKGLIIGGSYSAIQGIEANEIGNSMQTATSLFIGTFEEDLKRKREIEINAKKTKDEFLKVAKLLKVYIEKEASGPLTQQELQIRKKAQRSLQQLKEKYDELQGEFEQFEDLEVERGEVTVSRTIYPNVDVHFGKYRRSLTASYHQAIIALIDREIKIKTV